MDIICNNQEFLGVSESTRSTERIPLKNRLKELNENNLHRLKKY